MHPSCQTLGVMKQHVASCHHIFFAGVALLLLSLAGCDSEGPESPQAKQEWSTLQGVEYENRRKPLQEAVILDLQGFQVLGAPARNGTGNVWVLLRSKSQPYYKQMPPEVEYQVPARLIEKLEREGQVSEQVASRLRKGGV
jgi:hypothetical protein